MLPGALPRALSLRGPSLVLMRRGLALLCLADCLARLPWATLFYSDLGLLPRYRAQLLVLGSSRWSLLEVTGRPELAALFLLGTGLLALWVAGRPSRRWHRVLLWALMVSIQNRNLLLGHEADDLLRLMLFWDILLPNEPPGRVFTLGTLGYQFQLCIVLLSASFAVGGTAAGAILGLGAIMVWHRRVRVIGLVLLLFPVLSWASTGRPELALCLTVASLGLVDVPPWRSDSLVEALDCPRARLGTWLCWGLLLGLTVGEAFGGLSRPWSGMSEIMSLQQDWSELGRPQELSDRLVYRDVASANEILSLSPEKGKRPALFASRLAGYPRIAATSLDAAVFASSEPVELWLYRGEAAGERLAASGGAR